MAAHAGADGPAWAAETRELAAATPSVLKRLRTPPNPSPALRYNRLLVLRQSGQPRVREEAHHGPTDSHSGMRVVVGGHRNRRHSRTEEEVTNSVGDCAAEM